MWDGGSREKIPTHCVTKSGNSRQSNPSSSNSNGIAGCASVAARVPAPSLPDGVPTGQSGPRLVAFVGLLMGHFRQSKRRAAFFLQDFLGMPCCPSLTVKMQNQVAAALEQPYEELKSALADEPQLFMDESPTKQGDRKAWLWTAVAPMFAVFAIFSSRKAEALPKLLGNAFTGVINCDRAKMYWQAKQLQWCWAHLKHDFQALIDHRDPQVRRLGHDLMRQVRLMFDTWWRYKLNKISWDEFQRDMNPIRQKVDHLLLAGCSAATGVWSACVGNFTTIANGSGRSWMFRAWNRPTTRRNEPYGRR